MTDDELENGPTEACGHCGEEIASEAEACPACGELRSPQMCTLHPDRAATGQCVVCGTTVCETCNRGDRHYLCEQHKDVLVVQGWAEVYTTADDLEAHLIGENLDAEGIDARVFSSSDHFSLPVEVGDLSKARVLVPAYAYREAKALIAEHMDESGEVRFGQEDEAPLP